MTCAWCGKGLFGHIHTAPNYHDECLRVKLAVKAAKIAKRLARSRKELVTVI